MSRSDKRIAKPESRFWDKVLLFSCFAIMVSLPPAGFKGLMLVYLELLLIEGVLVILDKWGLVLGRWILIPLGDLGFLMAATPFITEVLALVILMEFTLAAV